MIFSARYLVELPYVLNIPDGVYDFLFEDTLLHITVNNDFYALYVDAALFPQTLLIGTREQLQPNLIAGRGIMKCRTIVTLASTYECETLDEISRDEFINSVRSQIRTTDSIPSEEDAEKFLASISQTEVDNKIELERIKKTARTIFPPTQCEECIGIINHFIKHYRVMFKDPFADEISLYQVGSGFTNGVLQEHYYNGNKVSAAPMVGLIPPLMRSSWFNHNEELVEHFKNKLMIGHFNEHPELLILRATNLMHKGALRSAVIEASAGLESYVLKLLLDALTTKGHNEEETKKLLSDNWKFDDRCKKLFKYCFNASIPEIAKLEWQIASKNRKELRDKIAHTSHEPTENETKNFISSITLLVEKIENHFKTTIKTKGREVL
ncbi:hypothetical protein [Citrobacter sp. Cpo091]|uniref:hypothetical protein n=1 Tax=Citrobacter sp. Cpo091 TaxID=2985140 RepID=UPI002578ACF6|nr:hypothetical protein [Citrobacter sp. Cpo091]MDM2834899.1 hypothetical protein [Citrobacter sp. Cpo091]